MIRSVLMLSTLALAACGQPSPADAPPQTSSEMAISLAEEKQAPASEATPGPIPVKFRDVWAIDIADCTREPGHTRIDIAPGAIRFYEGRAVVVNAEAQRSGTVAILDVDHMAEGTTERERHTLGLADAGESRLKYQRRGETFTYIRCPG